MRTNDMVQLDMVQLDMVQLDAAGLIASGRSGWELVVILVGGYVLYRVLENGKRHRGSNHPPGRTDSGSPSSPRASAADQEDDAVAWWFTSGRYGDHDPDADGPDRK